MGGALTRMLAGGAAPGPFGSHQYWKLEIDANNGNAGATGVSALVFKDQGGSVIATTGGTAFSGGSGSDVVNGDVARAFDGNPATSWQRSSATNVYCGYQFASSQSVSSIEISNDGAAANSQPRTCRLRYSDDGVTYTTAFEIWEPSWPGSGSGTRAWPQFASGKYKAIRLLVSANNGNRFVNLAEMEVRQTVGGADATTGGRATQNDSTGGFDAELGFDSNTGTGTGVDTFSTALPCWFQYAFPTVVTAAQYTVTVTASNAQGPKDFKLQGTNDGATWTDLNSQTAQSWSVPETKTYVV